MQCYQSRVRLILIGSLLFATPSLATDYRSIFKGPNAISPRLIVDEFSPWISDNYPGLVTSINIDAVTSNRNRLHCEKQEETEVGVIRCRHNGSISDYEFLGMLKKDVLAFRTASYSDSGTFVATTYRIFVVKQEKTATGAKGEAKTQNILQLAKDYVLPYKGSAEHSISGGFLNLTFKAPADGKETKVSLAVP